MKRLILFTFAASLVFGQVAFRIDPTPIFTTPGSTPPGASAPMYAVSGVSIQLCSTASCSTPAVAYTDGTASTPCPSNAAVTLPGSGFCQTTTSAYGQFGFWLMPGTYWYKAILPSGQAMGPFALTVGGSGGGGGGTGTVTSWSVGTVPSIFNYTVTNATTTPTFTFGYAAGQVAHQVLGTCGTATSFQPCSLQAGDVPTLNQDTTGLAAGLSAQYVDWNASSGGASIKNKPTLPTIASVNNLIQGDGLGSGVDSGIVPAKVLQSGDPAVAGWVDLYPPSDAVNSVGFVAPATRSTKLRLKLPATDPAGQVQICGSPGSNVSTCTWMTPVTTSGGVVALFTGCSGTQYLGADGACHTPSSGGSVTVSAGYINVSGGDMGSIGIPIPASHGVTCIDTSPMPYATSGWPVHIGAFTNAGTGRTAWAIYSSAGSLLYTSATQTFSTARGLWALTGVALVAGNTYGVCFTSDDAAQTMFSGTGTGNWEWVANQGAQKRQYSCTNTGTGTTTLSFPATCGTKLEVVGAPSNNAPPLWVFLLD